MNGQPPNRQDDQIDTVTPSLASNDLLNIDKTIP